MTKTGLKYSVNWVTGATKMYGELNQSLFNLLSKIRFIGRNVPTFKSVHIIN